jgi:hypothetical protein
MPEVRGRRFSDSDQKPTKKRKIAQAGRLPERSSFMLISKGHLYQRFWIFFM